MSEYPEWINPGSRQLTMEEYTHNGEIVKQWFMTEQDWTLNAVCGILGNMLAESSVNPGRYESDDIDNVEAGYGLVQWTPGYNCRSWIWQTYGSDADPSNGFYQLNKIVWDFQNGYYGPSEKYPENGYEWQHSRKSPGYLSAAFMINYERPFDQSDQAQKLRANLGLWWWTYFTGAEWKGEIPIWMMFKFNDWRRYK